jgi:hypothetical protein
MEAQIVELARTILAGVVGAAPDVSGLDIGALWQRFYDARFVSMDDPKSLQDVYVPVRRR